MQVILRVLCILMSHFSFFLFVYFLYLIFDRINVIFNRGRIAQPVERLTAECEVAGSFPEAEPLLRVLK